MNIYIFFRKGMWYCIEEESDEKVLKHIPLNPGTLKVEDIHGRLIWSEDNESLVQENKNGKS